ncbi:MAG: anti-sigma factor [Actinobacteria bacterium]|nr:anti-sigma factor [Actinomycetota bacterium]
MTRPDAHERYEELAAGHALSALEPEDEQVFLQHLGACARCERELAVHDATLAHLAYAPDDAEPPDSLLASIRAGVLASGRGASFSQHFDADADSAGRRPAAPVSLAAARRRRTDSTLRRSSSWTGIAAAAALMLGLGVWNATLQQDRAEQDAWGDRMAVAVRELRDADTDTVPLRGDDGAVVAVALVRGSELSLVVDGLPVNDDATTYVLWGQSRYGDVRPVGAFDVAREGVDVQREMQVQAGIADVTRFMVTREQGEQAPPIPQQAVLASGNV